MSHDLAPRAQIHMIRGHGHERILIGDPDVLRRALAVGRKAGTMVPCNRIASTEHPGLWFVRVRLTTPATRRRRWPLYIAVTAAVAATVVALAVAILALVHAAVDAATAVAGAALPYLVVVGVVLVTIGAFRGRRCHIEVKHWHS